MSTAIVKDMESKVIGGHVSQCKQVVVDGKPIGIVEGHIATFDVDRGDDRFSPGAFQKSLDELQRLGKTQLPLKDTHGRTIGGFPMDTLKEDAKGLFGIGHINLELEQGRDAYALAQQKVYDSFSIGFIPTDVDFIDGIREIRQAEVLEGSVLDIPMNLNARVTEVKELAEKVGVDLEKLSEDEYKDFVKHMDVYFKTLDKGAKQDIKALSLDDIKEMDERTLEKLFKGGVCFSGALSKALMRIIKASDLREAAKDAHREGDNDDWAGVLGAITETKTKLEEK